MIFAVLRGVGTSHIPIHKHHPPVVCLAFLKMEEDWGYDFLAILRPRSIAVNILSLHNHEF